MFCIAAFVVLFFCGIFSVAYRQLARKAWHCVVRRVTFRPCDINFSEEMKGKLLGKIILVHPRLARFVDRWIDAFAWLFAVLSIWSLASVAISGLNLWIYDTCSPGNPEGCSLSGEACSIASYRPGLWESVRTGHPLTWVSNEADTLGQTFTMIPVRLRTWNARDYVPEGSDTWRPVDAAKPWALEIVDPGCAACAHLFRNIKAAGFEDRYNLAYLAFPIPQAGAPLGIGNGYKFLNSYLLATWIEAMRRVKPEHPTSDVPADWRMLETIYTGTDPAGHAWQDRFNMTFGADEARAVLRGFAAGFGYTPGQIDQLARIASSKEVGDRLRVNKGIVEERIRTVKIPTILFGGRRYDRVVPPDKLK